MDLVPVESAGQQARLDRVHLELARPEARREPERPRVPRAECPADREDQALAARLEGLDSVAPAARQDRGPSAAANPVELT